MPKLRHLKGFGIVVLLAAIVPLWWWNGTITSGKSNPAQTGALSRSQDGSLHDRQDAGSARRVAKEMNAEFRVRSLLQIAPGEMGSIHIPASGITTLLSGVRKIWPDEVPLVPMTREQAIRGLEEIVRHGDSLGSKVDVCDGNIAWKGNGIAIDGTTSESEQGDRHLSLDIEAAAADGLPQKAKVRTSVLKHSFFLVLSPDPEAGGVLLVFGEDVKPGE